MKKLIKIFTINLAILSIFLISPVFLLRIYKFTRSKFTSDPKPWVDRRAWYPTYIDKDFSKKLFDEFSKLYIDYKSFIGWRRKKVNFKYTTIHGKYNTRKSEGEAIDDSVWFFGGSTMWGTGASDSQTIPSHFYSLTGKPVYNFGETAWITRQSLNQLINTLGDQHKPSAIIFYDGVNDVLHQCRKEIKSFPSHSRENSFNEKLSSPKKNLSSTLVINGKKFVKFIFEPYEFIKNNFNNKSNSASSLPGYDCHLNKDKALSIAKHLVENWHTGFLIASNHKLPFYGILQPTLFTTESNFEYFVGIDLQRISLLRSQYGTVYPLIIEEIKQKCFMNIDFCSSIVNGTDWLDGQKNIFIDFMHLNSHGNKIISQKIEKLLN